MEAGWLLGFVIGAVVVVIVVIVVLAIIWLASRIRDQAREAVEHLDRARRETEALWELGVTARAAAEMVGASERLIEDAEQRREESSKGGAA